MRAEIPLFSGAVNAHQRQTVQLGDNLIDLQINYVQSGQWSMDVYRAGVLLAAGCMLEPNTDVIRAARLDIGRLIFIGEDTTLDNLGTANRLVWVSPDE